MSENGSARIEPFDGNFDRERAKTLGVPHTFVIAEHEFEFRSGVEQETIDRYIDGTEEGASSADQLALLDETVKAFLLPEHHQAWEAARHSVEQPVLWREIVDVINYMISVITGRPFVPLPGSGSTPEAPKTRSTEDSPSPEAATLPA